MLLSVCKCYLLTRAYRTQCFFFKLGANSGKIENRQAGFISEAALELYGRHLRRVILNCQAPLLGDAEIGIHQRGKVHGEGASRCRFGKIAEVKGGASILEMTVLSQTVSGNCRALS